MVATTASWEISSRRGQQTVPQAGWFRNAFHTLVTRVSSCGWGSGQGIGRVSGVVRVGWIGVVCPHVDEGWLMSVVVCVRWIGVVCPHVDGCWPAGWCPGLVSSVVCPHVDVGRPTSCGMSGVVCVERIGPRVDEGRSMSGVVWCRPCGVAQDLSATDPTSSVGSRCAIEELLPACGVVQYGRVGRIICSAPRSGCPGVVGA